MSTPGAKAKVTNLKDHLGPILRVGLSSATAVVVEYLIYLALVGYVGIQYLVGSAVSSCVGLLLNFLINKYWALRNGGGDLGRDFLRYLLVVGIGIILGLLILRLLVGGLGIPYHIGRVASDIFVFFIWTYLANRYFVFRTPALAEQPLPKG